MKDDCFVKVIASRRPAPKLKIYMALIASWPVFLDYMNSAETEVVKAEKNLKYLSAISNLLEPEQIKTVPMRRFIPAMAPDSAEWSRRVQTLKLWRTEILNDIALILK